MRQRFKNKRKQQPTDQSKVWTKEKDRQKFFNSKLARDLADFEAFRNELLPMLRRDVLDDLPPDKMREKYKSYAQAREIMEALTNPDPKVALQAIQNMQNRVEGKPTEKVEHTHKFDNLTDEELDAILQSEEQELQDMKGRFEQ